MDDRDLELLYDPENPGFEAQFRKGAAHGMFFASGETKRLLELGASPTQILDRLCDLNLVVLDWRERQIEMPKGNPWDWSLKDLDKFIARRRKDW